MVLAMAPGPSQTLAAAEALVAHHAAMTATVGVSSVLGQVAAAAHIGLGGTASEAALVSHDTEHIAFAEETLVRAQIMHMAAAAHPTHVAQMVPAPLAHANRAEEHIDNIINPIVLGMLTPRIAELEMEYFGFMWPNNASAGLRYGALLDALGTALMNPSMPAISGGSIAAAAVAAATVAESAAMSGMQAAVGMVGSGASAIAGPAAALPATAMSAVSSSGSSTASPPANSVAAQPLSAVTHTAPPAPAQTYAPSQSSTGMYAPSPNANLMIPPSVPPTAAQSPVQPMMPRPPVTPPMSAAPGVTTFTPPAEPFSPPPSPSGGKAVGLKPGMLNAAALRGPVGTAQASTALMTKPLTSAASVATQPLAYVAPQHPLPPAPPTPPQPPLLSPGNTAQTLSPPPQPQQAPQPPPHTPPQPAQQQQPPAQPQQQPSQPQPQPQPNPNVGDAPNQGVQNLLGDLKDSPGAQALSVHNSQDVHDIVDPLPPGEHPNVKVLPTPEQIRGLYDQLTQNATPLPTGGYGYGRGEWAQLPDGTKIGYRPDSKFGGPTVEIWYPGEPKVDVHLPKEKVPKPQPAPQPAPEPHPVQVPATQTPAPETHEPVHDDPGHQIHVDPPPPGFWATVGGIVLGGLAVLGKLGQVLE